MSAKLTDTQVVILSAAAQRDDRCLVAPQNLKDSAAQKVVTKLIAAGFAKEIKAKPGGPVWRRDEQAGQSYSLKLTAAGARAIAIDESSAPDEGTEDGGQLEQAAASQPAIDRLTRAPSAPRDGTKLAQVIELLRRRDGATIGDLIAATGWLAHTTRAALTGLRKRGYAVTIDRSNKERGSIYCINPASTLEDDAAVARSEEAPPNSTIAPQRVKRRATSNARRAA